MNIREENASDHAGIRAINEAAFGTSEEADLIGALRSGGHSLVSLVAESDGDLAGHILFSRMWIGTVAAVALAPVAVLPDHQKRGIGGALIRHGLQLLRERGEHLVIVVGHPTYYPRFGFSTEKIGPLEHPFPQEVFMALELTVEALEGVRGKVEYPPPFAI